MIECGWVIEATGPQTPKYWDGQGTTASNFTTKHEDAVRFARQIDASIIISWVLDEAIRKIVAPREHAWGFVQPSPGKSRYPFVP